MTDRAGGNTLLYQLHEMPCGDDLVMARKSDGSWIVSGDYHLTGDARYRIHEGRKSVELEDIFDGTRHRLTSLQDAGVATCSLCHDHDAPCRRPGGVKWRMDQGHIERLPADAKRR